MSVVVFLGPTLPVEEARAVIDAVFLPPVKAGDIVRALALQPDAIGIVDGYFDRVPSVWHKEVLYALSQGVAVFGASSMGALRAAELHRFGMIGVGRIFEAFRDGLLEDDDEVAVTHARQDGGYRPTSDAMVNIRIGLASAEATGVIAPTTAAALVSLSKARFYADRSWSGVLQDAVSVGVAPAEIDALTEFLRRERPNQKRDDALELLRRLVAPDSEVRPAPSLEFHPTAYWQRLMDETEQAAADTSESSSSALATWLRVRSGGRSDVLREASVMYLISEAVEMLGLRVSDERVERERARFRDGGFGDDALEQLATADAILETLQTTRASLVDNFVRVVLARRGELAAAQRMLAERRAMLDDRGLAEVDPARLGLPTAELLEWYTTQVGLTGAERTPEALADRLGIQPRKMLEEILRWYLSTR